MNSHTIAVKGAETDAPEVRIPRTSLTPEDSAANLDLSSKSSPGWAIRLYDLIASCSNKLRVKISSSIRTMFRYKCSRVSAASANDPQQSIQQTPSTLLSVYLREPRKFTDTLLARNAIFLEQLEKRRDCYVDATSLRRHIALFEFASHREYSQLVTEDQRSRLLLTYHFGDFIYGLNYLVRFEPEQREQIVVSHSLPSKAYHENIQRAFKGSSTSKKSYLLSSSLNLLQLSSCVRDRVCTLVLFCDLPHGYGKMARVKFLNRWAWFPRGPATLGLANGIPLLPVLNFFDGKRHRIEIGQQIEPELLHGESLDNGVIRITQSLVNLFETVFVRYPEQWRYLNQLPLYFTEDGGRSA